MKMRLSFLDKISRNSDYRKANLILNTCLLGIFLVAVITHPIQILSAFVVCSLVYLYLKYR